MSFILQVFHAPAIRSVSEAAAWCSDAPSPSAANRVRHVAFRDAILRVYPVAADETGDDTDELWPERWSHEPAGEAVLVIAVATDRVDENFMRHVAQAAARADLHVLDPQGGRLYRPDGTSIDVDGSSRRIGPAGVPSRRRGSIAGFTEEALGTRLCASFIARHPELGFAASRWRSFADLDRSVGGVGQRIRFHVSIDRDEAMINVSMQLFCPAVAGVWRRLLGRRVAAYLDEYIEDGWRAPDVSLHTDDFQSPPGDRAVQLGARTFACVHSFAEADAFGARFDAWFAEQGAAAFQHLSSPAAIAAIALTDDQRDWLYRRNELQIDEIYSRLVLVGAFDATRKGEWMKAFRDHQRRAGKPMGKDLIEPDRNTALDDLFALLDGDAFAAEAARLRGDAA